MKMKMKDGQNAAKHVCQAATHRVRAVASESLQVDHQAMRHVVHQVGVARACQRLTVPNLQSVLLNIHHPVMSHDTLIYILVAHACPGLHVPSLQSVLLSIHYPVMSYDTNYTF